MPSPAIVLESLETRVHLSATPDGYFHWLSTTGGITGTVYADLNANGKRDLGERGVAGRHIYLDLNANHMRDANEAYAITDRDGVYRFVGLPAGRYFVKHLVPIQPPSSMYKTTMTCTTSANNRAAVAVAAGQTTRSVDFGIRCVPRVFQTTTTLASSTTAAASAAPLSAGASHAWAFGGA